MARVVQRRSAPPYLLIVVVMLFVAATALAAIFYNKYSGEAEKRRTAKARLDEVQKKLTVCESKDVPALVQKITGRRATKDVAVQEADQALKATHAEEFANAGMAEAIKGLSKKVDDKQKRIDELEGNEARHKDAMAQKDKDLQKLRAQYRQKQQEDAAALKGADDKRVQAVAAKDQQLQQAVADKDKIIAKKDQQITVLAKDIEDLRRELTKRQAIIAQQIQEIHDLKEPTGRPGDPLPKPDGKIAKVVPEQNLCYVDLGRKDGIRRGLPFSVYSARTGVTEKGVGKAKIVVISVGEITSECRIVESVPEDPIVEGDLVANLAYDSSRIHKFVVEGDFDLYGRGRADPLGNARVRRMIESWGAKVAPTVTVDTDFVVMGTEPATPPKPAADAPAVEWERYRQEMKKYQRYREVREAAKRLNVTILNTTRFLAFSGFAPGAPD